jgi:hypothetical protein
MRNYFQTERKLKKLIKDTEKEIMKMCYTIHYTEERIKKFNQPQDPTIEDLKTKIKKKFELIDKINLSLDNESYKEHDFDSIIAVYTNFM